MLAAASSAYADDSWNGSSSALWSASGNWDGTTVPGSIDTAVFSAPSSNTTIDLETGVTVAALLFDGNTAAAYTIGSNGAGAQTLTLGNAGAITLNPTVATNQLINANLALSSAAGATTTITNNSSGLLTIAGTVNANVASGNGRLTVAGSGNTTISGAVTKTGAGSNALLKTGAGTLTLSNGSTWSGTGASQSFGTGTNGNSAFTSPMIIQEGTLLLNGGTHTVTGEAVIGGIVAQGGAGQNAKIQIDSGALNISGYLSVGRGNGVGGVSSDLVLNNAATVSAANFSAGYNGGNGSNLPKGAITLNNTSSFTVNTGGAFNLGESAGSNMTVTLNDSATVTVNGNGSTTNRNIGNAGTGILTMAGAGATFTDASTSILNVGYQNGSGTINVNAGTFNHTNGEIVVAGSQTNATFTGTGTINVAGGTLNTKALTVGRNGGDAASSLNGTVNVSAGTLNVTAATSLIGWRGIGTTGTLTISGGTFNQGTTALANMSIGSFTGANGIVTVSSGALTFQNNSGLRFADTTGANASTRTLTISGGNVTFYSNAGTTVGGTGTIDLMTTANASGVNTINLNGGTLTANQIKATSATGTRVINFNGGTLKAAGNGFASTFLASGVASTANVRNGGAIIDTNGFNVTIGQALVHSTVGGDNAVDGGLTKLGTGTLTLTGTNTFTGNTTISAGTLTLGSSAASATFLADASSLYLTSGSLLNLSFTSNSVMESITGLFIDGQQQLAGTWGAVGSGATFENALITGTGLLNVTASAIPEPATYAAIFGALTLGVAALRRRRTSGRA